MSTQSPTVDPPEEESKLEEEEIIIEQIPGMDLLHANVAPETGPSLDPPVPPAEAPPEKALHISPDLTKVDNLVQERLDADPPSETTPPVEELAGAGEEDITVDFG